MFSLNHAQSLGISKSISIDGLQFLGRFGFTKTTRSRIVYCTKIFLDRCKISGALNFNYTHAVLTVICKYSLGNV